MAPGASHEASWPHDLDPAEESSQRLDLLAEAFPPEHAATVRLITYAVIARARVRPHPGAPAFAAYGAGGRGKTVLAEAVRWAFGWPQHWPIVVPLHGIQSGELVGRRIPSGQGRYRFEPSEYVSLPLICADELDKPHSVQVERDVFGLIDGGGVAYHEGQRIAVRAVVLATHNPSLRRGPDRLRTDQWARRTIGLDVDQCDRVDALRFAPLLAQHGPEIPLGRLPVDTTSDPGMTRDVLGILRERLTESAFAMVEPRMIPDLLIGRLVLPGDVGDLVEDLLLLAATRGELRSQNQRLARAPQERAEDEIDQALGLAADKGILRGELERRERELMSISPGPELLAKRDALLSQLEEIDHLIASARTKEELLRLGEHAGPILRAARAVVDSQPIFDAHRVEEEPWDGEYEDLGEPARAATYTLPFAGLLAPRNAAPAARGRPIDQPRTLGSMFESVTYWDHELHPSWRTAGFEAHRIGGRLLVRRSGGEWTPADQPAPW